MGVIKRQGIKNIFITYFGFIVGAISTLYIQPEFLSINELGFIRNLYNISFLFSLALPLGLPNVILKFYPNFKESSHIKDTFFVFILLYFSIACVITVPIFYVFKQQALMLYNSSSQLLIDYFYCIIPLSIIIGLNSCITYFCMAAKKTTATSFMNDVFSRLAVIVCIILYNYKLISFNVFVGFYVIIYLIVTLILISYLSHFGLITFKINWSGYKALNLKKMISFGLFLCVISFTTFGLRSIDSIFLGFYSLSNVAIYTTAAFLALFIEVPLGALDRISQSKITESFLKNDLTEISKIYSESVKYLLIIGGFIFLGINACSKYVLAFLPPEYSQSVIIVLILSFGSLVNISTGVNSSILFYSNHYKKGGFLLFTIFMITLLLDILIIPTYGLIGAAWVTASVSILFNISKFLFLYYYFKFQPYTVNSLKIVGVIALGFAVVYIMPSLTHYNILNIVINGGIISVFYIVSIYKLNVIPEIFEMVLSKFNRK